MGTYMKIPNYWRENSEIKTLSVFKKSMGEKTTVLYSGDNREYCRLNREVNRIIGEVRD